MAARLRPIDLTELRGLCLAIELGSLGRAAGAMSISQPALSKRMRELERLAGTALLERSPRGVRATIAGERLYREARTLLTHADAVEELLDGLRGERTPVRLAASHTIAEFLLAAPLAAYRERSGHRVTLELVSANSAVVRDLVRERRVDIGLAAAASDEQGVRGLRETPLCDDEVVVAVPTGHPWCGARTIELDAFLPTPMVMRDPGSDSRRVLAAALRARGLRAAPPLVEVGSTAAAIAAVVAEGAPAVLSARAVAASATLHAVRIAGLPLRRRFVLLTRLDAPAAPAAAELAEHLRASLITAG